MRAARAVCSNRVWSTGVNGRWVERDAAASAWLKAWRPQVLPRCVPAAVVAPACGALHHVGVESNGQSGSREGSP
eukprot:6586584-Pyramimonas_sp.AAC.1